MGFVVVAIAATVARWVLVGRLLGLPLRTMARPFLTVLVPTAVTIVLGSILLQTVSGAGRLVALSLVTTASLLIDLALLRLVAPGIVRDAMSVLPVPEHRCAASAACSAWSRPR